jgi:hypothetical protein
VQNSILDLLSLGLLSAWLGILAPRHDRAL